MKKRRLIADPILMIITLIVITGFQVYWLHNNYTDAKRSLQIQANAQFQETVRQLEIKNLKLKDFFLNASHKDFKKIMIRERTGDSLPGEEVITTVNALRDKIHDSLKVMNNVFVTMQKDSVRRRIDTTQILFSQTDSGGKKKIQLSINVDSLQDSLQLPELITAYAKKLNEQHIAVPFTILNLNGTAHNETSDMSEVTIGFTHLFTYKVQLGNTFPYLIKKIVLPILFSIFLVAVTIISFLLLYKNLLRQQRLAEIKNEFISNITHELKTPIATVGVAIEALKSFNAMHDPEKTKEYLDISANELQRLSLLVDKVLKLSMFEKKEMELKFETLHLKDIANEVITSMRLQIEKHHATVTLISEGDTTLQGDKLHLLSVVFNLLDNALKYSNAAPLINVDLQEKDHGIQLSVKDNGIGISPEFQKRIFEKFFRVPVGDRHDAKGYGLGLSYVAQVAEKHHGHIEVQSKPGEGTTFIIHLPKNQNG